MLTTPLTMTQPRFQPNSFVLCLRNDGYEASLERRKVYAVIHDAEAASMDSIRIIDESGEDYVYPTGFFVPIALPASAQRALAELARHTPAARSLLPPVPRKCYTLSPPGPVPDRTPRSGRESSPAVRARLLRAKGRWAGGAGLYGAIDHG